MAQASRLFFNSLLDAGLYHPLPLHRRPAVDRLFGRIVTGKQAGDFDRAVGDGD